MPSPDFSMVLLFFFTLALVFGKYEKVEINMKKDNVMLMLIPLRFVRGTQDVNCITVRYPVYFA
jgi:hypothetical protein